MPRDRTENWKRHRLAPTASCAKGSFRTKVVKAGVQVVVCCPKGKWNAKRKHCHVGMKAQSTRVSLGDASADDRRFDGPSKAWRSGWGFGSDTGASLRWDRKAGGLIVATSARRHGTYIMEPKAGKFCLVYFPRSGNEPVKFPCVSRNLAVEYAAAHDRSEPGRGKPPVNSGRQR